MTGSFQIVAAWAVLPRLYLAILDVIEKCMANFVCQRKAPSQVSSRQVAEITLEINVESAVSHPHRRLGNHFALFKSRAKMGANGD